MIHGLSKHTQGAGGAVDYFLDDQYFDQPEGQDPETGEQAPGEWRERDPKPVVLEGDPAQIVALCDSLSFKNKYTSAVLSFSPAETAWVNANPGMKESIIEDLRQFAYAGVKSEDCKPLLVVQHEHTGRLELHYLIPRVSLDSGKYFNPYPPNYDGRQGRGTNDVYKKQNDTFTDYMCSKYGLQNPRDPSIAREVKINKYDSNKVDKKAINDAVGKLIDSGGIKSREDIISFLEKAGGTITRKGTDYISVKFDGNQKAMRLKGEYYGERSYSEIRERIERTAERINRPFEEIEQEYNETLSERASEVESRHGLKGLAADRAEDFDLKSTAELRDYGDELKATKDSLGDYDESRNSVNTFIVDNPSLVHAADAASGTDCAIEGGVDSSLVGPIQTGDPIIDRMLREFHKMLVRQVAEELQRSKKRWQIDPEQEKRLKEIREWITKLFAGLSLGRNFFSGSAKPMAPREIAQVRQMIVHERRDLERELRAVATVIKQRERVEPLREILGKPGGHADPVVDAKPTDIEAGSSAGLQTSTADIDELMGLKRGKDGKLLKPKKLGDDDGSDGTTYG
jgi:tRNA-dihydrouridine synthase